MRFNRIWLKSIGSGHGVAALGTFTITFTAVAAIAVTAAAFALWALLAVLRFCLALLPLTNFLSFLRCLVARLNIGGRGGWRLRVDRFAQAQFCHHSWMGGVKTVDLRHMDGCFSAVGAFTATLATAVAAFTSAFAGLVAALFSANAIARFTASVLRTTLACLTAFTARVLLRPVLARCAGLAIHGCGHGGLIGQCQVLLDRVASNALASLGAFATFSALRALGTLAAAVATAFTVGAVWARLGVG